MGIKRRETVRTLSQIAEGYVGQIEHRQEQGGLDLIGLTTGYQIVDEMTAGMQPDELWIYAARASVGKTAGALGTALANAKDGKAILFYSLEMSGESLVNRLLAAWTNISAGRILRGKLNDDELRFVKEKAALFTNLKFGIIDRSMSSVEMCEHALSFAEESEVSLVVADYAGLFRDKNENEVQRLNEISANLRTLARPDHLNVPVLMLVQLNRATEMSEDGRPSLHNLKGSGAFEQDAENVLLFHRPYKRELLNGAAPVEEEEAEIIVAKCRNGPIGSTKAIFRPRTMTWVQERPKPVKPPKQVTPTQPAERPLTMKERVQKGRD